jgi:hypothetical protein
MIGFSAQLSIAYRVYKLLWAVPTRRIPSPTWDFLVYPVFLAVEMSVAALPPVGVFSASQEVFNYLMKISRDDFVVFSRRFFMTLAETPITVTSEQRRLLMEFLRLTGYGPSDILSLSYETNIFLTRNGGKYKLINHKIKHLSGPNWDPDERM